MQLTQDGIYNDEEGCVNMQLIQGGIYNDEEDGEYFIVLEINPDITFGVDFKSLKTYSKQEDLLSAMEEKYFEDRFEGQFWHNLTAENQEIDVFGYFGKIGEKLGKKLLESLHHTKLYKKYQKGEL